MTEARTGEPPGSRLNRKRMVILGAVTIALIIPWVAWTHLAARHVRKTTVTRMFASALLGGHRSGDGSVSPFQALLRSPGLPKTQPAAGTSEDLRRQIAWVESVVWYWERVMYAVAGCLAVAGVLAIRSLWPRQVLSVAGVLILACTVGTLICLWALSHPRYGDLPPLSSWTYVAVGLLQGGLGLALLLGVASGTQKTTPARNN